MRDFGIFCTDLDVCHQEINEHKIDETGTKLSDN